MRGRKSPPARSLSSRVLQRQRDGPGNVSQRFDGPEVHFGRCQSTALWLEIRTKFKNPCKLTRYLL
jgi:hypothetical protein